jgi:hypothetical protein
VCHTTLIIICILTPVLENFLSLSMIYTHCNSVGLVILPSVLGFGISLIC